MTSCMYWPNGIIPIPNNCVVTVPEGYHPVGAPHGYDLYYLNVMAGPTREWVFKNDPDHEWIMDKERNQDVKEDKREMGDEE